MLNPSNFVIYLFLWHDTKLDMYFKLILTVLHRWLYYQNEKYIQHFLFDYVNKLATAGRPGDRSSTSGRVKNFHSFISSRRALGPPNVLFNGYRGIFPRVKSGLGVKLITHLPTSAEVKKTWVHTSTPSYVFLAQCLIS
jgi:hypothetical protein